MFQNIRKLLITFPYPLFLILLWGIFGYIWYTYTDISILFWNHGKLYASIDILFSWIMNIVFPFFLLWIIYKTLRFWKKSHKKGSTFLGSIGWIIGTIISWSTCCSASLLTYFWLTTIIVQFPLIEENLLAIKIIGTLVLIIAAYDTFKNLENCSLKPKKTGNMK